VIIGAGWAGMGAADHLVRSNFSKFVVLEATGRTGGRSEAFAFGDASIGRKIFELGSNWVCGVDRAGGPSHKLNPVYQQAMKQKFSMTLIPGSTQNQSNYQRVYDSNGTEVDVDGSLRRKANHFLDCLNHTASHSGKDMTVRDGLIKCGWEPKNEIEKVVDWGMTVDDPGFPAELQSLWYTLPDETYMWWGGDDYFVVDQHPRGYAHLLDTLTASTLPPSDSRIIFNTTVAQIDYTCSSSRANCVTVTSTDGRVFRTNHVISTLPLGVLQHHHSTLFVPPMPENQIHALTRSGAVMGNLTKIFLQFKQPFWDPSVARWLAADSEEGSFPEYHNMNHPTNVPGSNTLLLFLGDPQSSEFESQSDAVVKAAVMKRLQRLYPGKILGEPTDFLISRHGFNPLRYGAYSGYEMGFTDHDFSQMNKPLKVNGDNTVYFSGEHTCDDLSGFTHGALISGRERASEYLRDHHHGPKYVSMCDSDDNLKQSFK